MTTDDTEVLADGRARWPLGLLATVLIGPIVLSAVILMAGADSSAIPLPPRPIGAGSERSAASPISTAGPRPDDAFRADPRTAVRVGVAVDRGDPELVEQVELTAGVEVGIVRVFARWDTEFPSARHRALLDAGRTIHLSVRPRTDAGQVIPWADVAAAQPGTATHDQLVRWAEAVAAYGDQIYFTFNHEPETTQSEANGRAEDFVAAWRRTIEVLRAADGDEVRTVLVLGRGAFETGAIERWYPGDDVVDVVGVDPYNWYQCQGTNRPWTSPADLIAAALDFATAHHKPLAVPEIASTEDPDDPNRKADWIRELGSTLGSPEVAEHVEFVAWFDVHDPAWPDCRWAIDSTPASAAAFSTILTDLTSP